MDPFQNDARTVNALIQITTDVVRRAWGGGAESMGNP